MLEFFSIKVSNILDPDHAGCFVGSDQGPNCLRRLSADKKSQVGKELNTEQLLFCLIYSLRPINNHSVIKGPGLPGLSQY